MENTQAAQLMECFTKFRRVMAKGYFAHPVPRSEFMVLHALTRAVVPPESASVPKAVFPAPGIKVSTLSKRLHISMPSVSQVINSLEEKELVLRTSTKTDRRVVYVYLTPKGVEVHQQIIQSFLQMMEKISQRMGEEDTATLIHLFNKLYDILQDTEIITP